MAQEQTFSIRQMIDLSGLSEFTIRGWENRYRAFAPQRGKTGRRHYNKNDIERALLFRELLKRGQRIGKIAKLSNQKLKDLFENSSSPSKIRAKLKDERHSDSIQEALELMALQKWDCLAELFQKVSSKNVSDLVHLFFLPLLANLTRLSAQGHLSIAQEHVVTAFLKEKIYSALSDIKAKKNNSTTGKTTRFVLAIPEGDYHEIGLLLAHLLIRAYGFTTLYIGPHTPEQDLSETVLRYRATHLLIVSTVSKREGANLDLLNFVSKIQQKIGSRLKILLAGSQVPISISEHQSTIRSFKNFLVFESYLKNLRGEI